MRKFTKKFSIFLKREDGPTAVEYAIALALIIVVCIAAVNSLGGGAKTTFQDVGHAYKYEREQQFVQNHPNLP